MPSTPKIIAVVGPTASGKTRMAIAIARALNCPIISFDARQFYQEMQIGTARPNENELAQAAHHFIGHISIHDAWNAGKFASEAHALMQRHTSSTFVLVGGSGLYLRALIFGLHRFPDVPEALRKSLQETYQQKGITWLQTAVQERDPLQFAQMDTQNPQRLLRVLEVCLASEQAYSAQVRSFNTARYPVRFVAPQVERDALYARIDHRVTQMMAAGLLEEARTLLPFRDLEPLKTVGYRELFAYFLGAGNRDDAIAKIQRNTRRYAKRQLTWFRHQIGEVEWVKEDELPALIERLYTFTAL